MTFFNDRLQITHNLLTRVLYVHLTNINKHTIASIYFIDHLSIIHIVCINIIIECSTKSYVFQLLSVNLSTEHLISIFSEILD